MGLVVWSAPALVCVVPATSPVGHGQCSESSPMKPPENWAMRLLTSDERADLDRVGKQVRNTMSRRGSRWSQAVVFGYAGSAWIPLFTPPRL